MTDRASEKSSAPAPDDERKPDSPDDLEKPTTGYILKRTVREFSKDQCTDLAAALTYYAVLALFPALLALLSLLGLVGQSQNVTSTILDIVRGVAPGQAASTLEPIIRNLTQTSAAGFALVFGLLGALWSASGYVGAFSRAMNRVYEIDEGRPFWKLRPVMILVTLIAVVLIGVALVILVVSGPVAQSIGNAIGLGSTVVTVWQYAKWPVLALVVVLVIAILYYATPNLKMPKFRWMSMGSFIAIVVWLVASVAFAFYVANFGSYQKTYGALAGAIVLLLWLWITNLALLFGAEVDAEVERGRELQAGIRAEESVQLPPRDTSASEKKADKEQQEIDEGYELRLRNGGESHEKQTAREARERAQGDGSRRAR